MRTCYIGNICQKQINNIINLFGWIDNVRNHGKLIFIDLRDRSGLIQITFNETNNSIVKKLKLIKNEFCINIIGKVKIRPNNNIKNFIFCKKIEILSIKFRILNKSIKLPFNLKKSNISEEIRLKNRFLDLKRPIMQKNIIKRYNITLKIRKFLDNADFIEIETPFLTKNTPEGAKNYIVCSNSKSNTTFSLPQSPQLFKQILMIAGFDKYYQITKCFRNEDLRSDRQPEFTQIDCELSFLSEIEICKIFEKMIIYIFKNILNIYLKFPFTQISWEKSMNLYGCDKPDLRKKIFLNDVTEIMNKIKYNVFNDICSKKYGKIISFNISKIANVSKNDINRCKNFFSEYGLKNFFYIKVGYKIKGSSKIKNLFSKKYKKYLDKLVLLNKPNNGDIIFIIAGEYNELNNYINYFIKSSLLNNIFKKDVFKKNIWHPIWVIDFPMFYFSNKENRYKSFHHPFTNLKEKYKIFVKKYPNRIISRSYDLVINGFEIGGGSIRINSKKFQNTIFKKISLLNKKSVENFEFFTKALNYGAPPHGGIAIGLDRLCTLMSEEESIRNFIAFPKSQNSKCLLTKSPSLHNN